MSGPKPPDEHPPRVSYAVAAAGVATITLDAPATRNALTGPMLARLAEHLAAAAEDDAVRVIVISHAGTVFCSGMDLSASHGAADTMPVNAFPTVLQAIWDCPKPVIARVGGAARAGGLGLLAACDIAVALRSATFAFTEVRLGLVPAVIATVVLPRITAAAAHELFLTGEVFDGDRARAIGLVDTVADDAADVDAEVTRYAELLGRGAPEALAGTKALLRRRAGVDLAAELAAASADSAARFASAEGQEGIAAFKEKHPARWVP